MSFGTRDHLPKWQDLRWIKITTEKGKLTELGDK